jgi:hypothetical protein
MKRRFVLAGLIALTLVGASWPLNPLVTRVAEPTGSVPLGCDESLAPAATPRVNVAEIPERAVILPAAMPAPPPSRSLREELDAAHRALARNDRPAFDEHLRAAQALVAAHPAGTERSRAEEVLWALNDAAVLWDAQFASPFFDENSDAYARASRYAGYAEAVRRSVLTDDRDRRFYPAAESRDFITRVAGERLQRLGVRSTATAPSRVARAETPARQPAVSSPSPTRRSTTRATGASSSPSSSSTRRRSPSTSKSRKPAALAKSTSSTTPSTDAPASPVVEDVAPTPVASDTATTTAPPVTTSSPDSAVEPAPPTTTTAAPSVAPAERRSVIVPALLILIGLGVLIVLFRASK